MPYLALANLAQPGNTTPNPTVANHTGACRNK